MNRTRLMVALGGFGFIIAAACTSTLSNGEECLKNADCESDRCIQYVCVEPTASQVPATTTDAAAEAEAAAADTGSETATDSRVDAAEVAAETSSDTSAD